LLNAHYDVQARGQQLARLLQTRVLPAEAEGGSESDALCEPHAK